MTLLQPRPYQLEAIEQLRENVRKGIKRQLLVMPTGTGKTLTASTMIQAAAQRGKRVLFVAHRIELIDQTVRTMQGIGLGCGVIRGGDRRRSAAMPVQVASIATLARRSKPPADLVFIDEAHRALAQSYGAHVLEAYPNAVHIGLTATPCRADGRPLGSLYSAMVQAISYEQAIADGYLSSPRIFGPDIDVDFSRMKTTGGDFDPHELAKAMSANALVGNIVGHWKTRAEGRRTVCFAVGVEHSRAIVQRFLDAGVTAEHLDGTTPELERQAILARLADGTTQVVCNVGVLCEGWDMPSCKCLILARPTKSLALFLQMCGRIFRPWEGIQPLILDHAGNTARHGLPQMDREWSLLEKTRSSRDGIAPTKECTTCFARIAASARACPHCEADLTPEPGAGGSVLEEVEGELVEIKPPTEQDREAWYENAVARANRSGLKPGWVWHAYKEKFFLQMPSKLWARCKAEVKGPRMSDDGALTAREP